MNRDDRLLLATGTAAAVLGVGAGIAEILAGTVSWAGNKNDPTTLGWVTVVLGVVVGAATLVATRVSRPAAQLGCAAALVIAAGLGVTTAGLAWLPAAIAASAAFVLVVRRRRQPVAWRTVARTMWIPALVVVLALIYLAFGIVARDGIGLLGVAGAVLAVAALVLRRRSRTASVLVLVIAAVPFAVATAWTVVIPFTAVLMLAIGLPHLLGRPRSITSRGATS